MCSLNLAEAYPTLLLIAALASMTAAAAAAAAAALKGLRGLNVMTRARGWRVAGTGNGERWRLT